MPGASEGTPERPTRRRGRSEGRGRSGPEVRAVTILWHPVSHHEDFFSFHSAVLGAHRDVLRDRVIGPII